jgi:hypothetical protein
MENERDDLLATFKKLDPENQADMLAHVRVAYAAQENTKKRYGSLPGSIPAQTKADGKPAA